MLANMKTQQTLVQQRLEREALYIIWIALVMAGSLGIVFLAYELARYRLWLARARRDFGE